MIRILTRWCLLGVIVCAAAPSIARAQQGTSHIPQPATQLAAASDGELRGIVYDDQGQPLAGAVVSALGATSAFAVTDRDGRVVFRALPAGPFLVRAHLQGYLPARGRIVAVNAGGRTTWTIALTRSGSDQTPAVLAAGVGGADVAAPAPDAPVEHEHGEVAWRLRHLKRSVLKDEGTSLAGLTGDESFLENSLVNLGHAVGTPARLASALFADVPLNAQINLLTSTSFDRPQDLFSVNAGAPRGVAYASLVAPTAGGEWTMRGTVTQGDLSSWIVAGSYTRRAPASHQYEVGLSYSMQRYQGGNAEALAAMRDGSRNVGAIYAYDTWWIKPRVNIGYGAKYASYDYLTDRGLVSPRASLDVQPFSSDPLRVRASVSHRETAPGAEEFIPPSVGLWLPPERTFSAISSKGFVPERLDHVEIAVEREITAEVVVGVRTFHQRVDDQLVTVFGVAVAEEPISNGHYRVGSAGSFEAHGWGVTVSRVVAEGFQASIDYSHTDTDWLARSFDVRELRHIARSALRRDEPINDLTASLESAIAVTATRVRVLYKVNDAFSGIDSGARPGAAGRFDVQVNQALPFLHAAGGKWEMLVAVRNLFREDVMDGSVYDELLVVRPPKRVHGGVTVRF